MLSSQKEQAHHVLEYGGDLGGQAPASEAISKAVLGEGFRYLIWRDNNDTGMAVYRARMGPG